MATKTQVAASVWGTFDLHSSRRSWMLFGTTRLIDLFVCVGSTWLLFAPLQKRREHRVRKNDAGTNNDLGRNGTHVHDKKR